MKNAEQYLAPIFGVHLSLMIGVLAYACKYCDRNSQFGVKTPYTLRSDENWNEVNGRVARVVPAVAALGGAIAISGLVVPAMRNPFVIIGLVAMEVAAVIAATVRHAR